MKIEKIIDGETVMILEKPIKIWGIHTPPSSSLHHLASAWFLEEILKDKTVSCSAAQTSTALRCYSGSQDVGSLMVQMGMATAADHYYDSKQALAKKERRGLWK